MPRRPCRPPPPRSIARVLAVAAAMTVGSPLSADADVRWARRAELPWRKAPSVIASPGDPPAPLATLVQTHTTERVLLEDLAPSDERFSLLLADIVTGDRVDFDPRLIALLRALARSHPMARVELVSGYRSPKRNEAMRKKGHHVASHSQHALGHALDFRVVEASAAGGGMVGPARARAIDPRVLEREIRALGWDGGVGVYLQPGEWFVHADVGKNRRWSG